MAISIEWGTRVITVPQADLTFISGTLYALDTSAFRLALKDLEDDEEGIPYPDTHIHNTEVTIAGVTYARTIEIINGYTVTFEDGMYAVRLDGSNNNIFDEGIINRNSVSIIPTNSAGLQIVTFGSGLSAEQTLQLTEIHGQTRRAVYVDTTVAGGGGSWATGNQAGTICYTITGGSGPLIVSETFSRFAPIFTGDLLSVGSLGPGDCFDFVSGGTLEAFAGESIFSNTSEVTMTIDTIDTEFAVGDGYQQSPFNLISSGISTANAESLSQIHVKGPTTIDGSEDLSGLEFFGSSIIGTVVTVGSFSPTVVVSDERTQFHNMELTGGVTSSVVFESCLLNDFAASTVIATDSILAGTIYLNPQPGSPSVAETSQFITCRDSSLDSPTIEFGDGTHNVNIRDYIGKITLSNMEAGNIVEIGLNGGTVTLDASCTGGSVVVTGSGEIIDNSGAVTVDESQLIYQTGGRGFGDF